MVEAVLRHYLQSRWRRANVIILSLLILLLTVWPAVDQYSQLRDRSARLQADLNEITGLISQTGLLEQQAQAAQSELKPLEAACVGSTRLAEFRGRVVELARQSGCQIRRVHVGEPQRAMGIEEITRVAGNAAIGKNGEIKHLINTQGISVALNGRGPAVREFLKRFLSLELLVQKKRLTLRPLDGSSTEVELELDCLLYDLVEEQQ